MLNMELYFENIGEKRQAAKIRHKDNGNDVPCASTEDRVYLLSAKELRAFFPKDQDRICKATTYARERGGEIEAGPNQCHWWLRCPAMGLGMRAPRVGADSTAQGGAYLPAMSVCARLYE